jgi:inorganic phosphate transporter, PiT family
MHNPESQGQPVASPASLSSSNVDTPPPKFFKPAFFSIITVALIYIASQLFADLSQIPQMALFSFALLAAALIIALGFEFVNGFHDTANAVATVIYTNAMPAHVAVMWAGFFNFLGVLFASGAVAYGILALLPVELILNVSSGAGFAMVFALLIAAITWNLGTWYFGIPASSSHTMVGSIIGVGLMNQLLNSAHGTSGVDIEQVIKVGKALLFSPLIGFAFAAVVFLLLKFFFKKRLELFKPPVGNEPPSLGIRAMLIFTCTGVSFAHGSNDGQKGMGLIMLILIGIAPLAYSLNKTLDGTQVQSFVAVSQQAVQVLAPATPAMTDAAARATLTGYIQDRQVNPQVIPALAVLSRHVGEEVATYGSLNKVPANAVATLRNDMYLSSAALKRLDKDKAMPTLSESDSKVIDSYRKGLDQVTQYIPTWVKVAVALALGLGTMVGWKRIVVTVGERIGKSHMTYGQGMAAELVAMTTIGIADRMGMPVSTTHVLNSAVAGTMAANKSGLQWSTIRTILSAWVLTLPATVALSGGLYWLFLKFV